MLAGRRALPLASPHSFNFIVIKLFKLSLSTQAPARVIMPLLADSTLVSMRILERASGGLRCEKCRILLICLAAILIRRWLRAERLPGLVY
jgi:hypothetical protein